MKGLGLNGLNSFLEVLREFRIYDVCGNVCFSKKKVYFFWYKG